MILHNAISGCESSTRVGRIRMHQLKSQTAIAHLFQGGDTGEEGSAAGAGERAYLSEPATACRRRADDLPVNVAGDVLAGGALRAGGGRRHARAWFRSRLDDCGLGEGTGLRRIPV